MKQRLSYIVLACLILINILLLLGAFYEHKPLSDELFTGDITGSFVWAIDEEDSWFSIAVYKDDPKPGQVLTWTGSECKWLYLKDIKDKK